MKRIRAIIIDDEPLACSLLQFMLQSSPEIDLLHISYSPADGIQQIDDLKPDLIFLDIQMPQITGIELLEMTVHKPQVIFTTAFDEHAIKAFELNAVDYLLKPYTTERLLVAIEKVKKKLESPEMAIIESPQPSLLSQEKRDRIIVKDRKQLKIIPLENIYYLEGAQDYVKIYTTEGMYVKHSTMSAFEEQLDEMHFLRCHRSYIVNTDFITSIKYEVQRYTVILRNGNEIPVSRNRQHVIKKFVQ